MQTGPVNNARRTTLAGMGSFAVVSILAPCCNAQGIDYDGVAPIGARVDFDIPGGKFNLLEHEPASQRLRTTGSRVGIRFQIEDAYLGPRWVPMVGFSLGSEDGLHELQVDFADLPVYEHLMMVADLITYVPRQKRPIVQVQVPKFARREIQDIQIALESEASVAIVIDGKRRPIEIDFQPHRLVVRASGVKGWVEFAAPMVA
jgi:hypothetical protein